MLGQSITVLWELGTNVRLPIIDKYDHTYPPSLRGPCLSTQSNATTPANPSPSQSFSETEISSPLTSKTSAATAITTSVGLSRTDTMASWPTTSVDPAPPRSSASSLEPSHSSPRPGPSNSSAIGSTANSGSSTAWASQTQTLPASSTEFSSIIISSSAMPGSTSPVSVSTTQPTSVTVSNQHGSQTDGPCPSMILSNPDASSFSTLPTTSLPFSSEIRDPTSSGAADGRLNTAIIAGVAIGGAALLAIIVFGFWFLRKIKNQPDDDDISMVGIPRDEDVPPEMRNGIKRVRGNDDWN